MEVTISDDRDSYLISSEIYAWHGHEAKLSVG